MLNFFWAQDNNSEKFLKNTILTSQGDIQPQGGASCARVGTGTL